MALQDEQPESRDALYQRIRSSSRDEVTREEMIKHGFWNPGDAAPQLTEEWFAEQRKLTSELNELLATERKYRDPEAALREIHKLRKEESKKKRALNKEKREQARVQRAESWRHRKTQEIGYLGEAVSGGLNQLQSDIEKLQLHKLPAFPSALSLARAMGVSIGELRFLAFNRRISKISHYKRFHMPKKTGGTRLISAPMPRLKSAQRWILDHLLSKIAIHDCAHGFLPKHSIVSNAAPHAQAAVVINMDLRDFFPSITYKRVKGVFRSLGYSEQIATILALICSEAEMRQVELDGVSYYAATGERHLPQGAPTSPALTNILAYSLDRRLTGIARSLGCQYTRYADDLTFSGSKELELKKLLWRVKSVIQDEGFTFHPDKLRIMRKGSRQEVTGLTVNSPRPTVNRKDLRRFRALLFQLERDGIRDQHWNGHRQHLLATALGYVHFVNMVDSAKGVALIKRVKPLLERYSYSHEIRHPAKPKGPPPLSSGSPVTSPADGKLPREQSKKPFWQRLMFWKK